MEKEKGTRIRTPMYKREAWNNSNALNLSWSRTLEFEEKSFFI